MSRHRCEEYRTQASEVPLSTLPTGSLVMFWAFSSTISDWPFFFHWIPSHKLICPCRTCSPAVVAATVNAAMWQLPVVSLCISVIRNYSSLGSKPINELHWNQICILVSELPRTVLIRVPLSGQVQLFLFPSHFKHGWEVQYRDKLGHYGESLLL